MSHPTLKLGKQPFVPDDNDFQFGAIRAKADVAPPPVPNSFGYGRAFTDWEMFGNGPDDTVQPGFGGAGDCVFAGGDHEHKLEGHLMKLAAKFSGKTAIDDYSAVTGYVIGDDSTDQGTIVRDAAKYRRATGLVDVDGNRHKIGAYVSINPKDFDELMLATYVFTAVGIGFEFPATAWDQFDAHQAWDVVDDNAEIEGGHYIPVIGRNGKNTATAVTWARRQTFTRAFYEAYNDETWAYIFPEELRNGKTHRGFPVEYVTTLLNQLK